MNEKRTESLLEIALEEMGKKRKPKSIAKIAKDVFELKGYTQEEAKQALSQFEMDFMLSGHFICCGEDPKTGEKLWDLKNRQPFALIEKDGNSLDDPYDDDEDVKANELNDDTEYELDDPYDDKDDDTEDEEEEQDDIAEELDMFADIDDSIKCPFCKHKISPDATVCPFCGASLEEIDQ